MVKLAKNKSMTKNLSSEKNSILDHNTLENKIDTLFENWEKNKTRKTSAINQERKKNKFEKEIRKKEKDKSKKLELRKPTREAKKADSHLRRKLKSKEKEIDLNKRKKKLKEKKKSKIYFYINKTGFRAPKKITIKKIIWILFLFFITVTIVFLFFLAATGYVNMKILFVSIFIGIAVLKELTDEYVPNHQKKKINIIVSGFIIIFILVVINEIISFISR